jgi:lysophospholipase L1-like esterase
VRVRAFRVEVQPLPEVAAPLRYVALGDSYTIGTAVTEPERWPDQLVSALGGAAAPLRLAANLAVNGFTTADVIAEELPRLDDLRPDFVTLLIGVNDVVQGMPDRTYRAHLETILDDLVRRLAPSRVLAVTTPDYTVTPAGADYGDPAERCVGIVRANDTMNAVAGARGISVVDIFGLSQRAATDRSLVAADGLHPSGAQYALWVARIAPVVRELLAR